MRKLVVLLALALVIAGSANAVTLWSNQIAASGTGTVVATAGKDIAVQVCGTAFTGTVTIYQGSRTDSLTATKTLTLTGYATCAEYYDLRRSNVVRVDFTRSSGTLKTVELEIGK